MVKRVTRYHLAALFGLATVGLAVSAQAGCGYVDKTQDKIIAKPVTVASGLIDANGYPVQKQLAVQVIPVEKTPPYQGVFVFTADPLNFCIEDVDISFSGDWHLLDKRRNPKSETSDIQFAFSHNDVVSDGHVNELRTGVSATEEAELDLEIFSGKVSVTEMAQYAHQWNSNVATGVRTSDTYMVRPGEEVQVWGRKVKIEVSWKPTKYDFRREGSGIGQFEAAQDFLKDIYLPSWKHYFGQNGFSPSQAEGSTEPFRLTYQADPAIMNPDTLPRHLAAQGLLIDFLEEHGDGFSATYVLPREEIYPVRFMFD